MEERLEPTQRFLCIICRKSFDNNKSQVRHSRYCRERVRNPVKPRKKSCISCIKAKARCEAELPACSRCIQRNLICEYQNPPPDSRPPPGLSELVQKQDFVAVENEQAVSEQTLHSDSLLDQRGLVAQTPSAVHKPYALTNSSSYLDNPNWLSALSDGFENSYDPLILNGDEAIFGGQGGLQSLNPYPRLPPSAGVFRRGLMIGHSEYSLSAPYEVYVDNRSYLDPICSKDSRLPSIFSDSLVMQPVLRGPKSFIPRRYNDRRAYLNKSYILCTLQSYPLMINSGGSLPPFIHSRALGDHSGQYRDPNYASLTGPLSACGRIVTMWSVKNKANTPLIWRAIRREQERLSDECYKYNDQTAVAALQAVTIYFLLRLSEKDEEVTDFDIPLIHTMIKIALRLEGTIARYSEPSNGRLTWEDWILAESLLRTILALFIVALLVDVTPGLPYGECEGHTALARVNLPATKDTWQAQIKSEWENEYMATSDAYRHYGVRNLKIADLLRFGPKHDVEENGIGESLKYWLARADEFSTLVVAATNLVELGD